MPHSYTVCILLSLVPPVWKRIMNPYADAANKNERLSKEKRDELDKLVWLSMLGEAIIGTVAIYIWMQLIP